MLLEERTPVNAAPETVYRFFADIDQQYEAWHPDHITFRWEEGSELEVGNTAYFEERIGGELKQLTIRYTQVDPGRYIKFAPVSRWIRLLMPQLSFTIEPTDDGCLVTQRIKIRTGPIGARLNRREFDAVRTHMHEEGVNLRRIVESSTASGSP